MTTATATESSPAVRRSRIGKRPIPIPKGVNVDIKGRTVDVQGPKGKLKFDLPERVNIKKDGSQIVIESTAEGRDAARLQGLGRALVANLVRGAAEGYEVVLELVGTGYRSEVKGRSLVMQLGFSHPSVVELPATINATVPADSKGTQIVLSSADKALVGQFAASSRRL